MRLLYPRFSVGGERTLRHITGLKTQLQWGKLKTPNQLYFNKHQ